MRDDIEPGVLDESDVARKYCRGNGDAFGGKACEHYDSFNRKCDLLAKNSVSAVVEHGRCLSEVQFYVRAGKILEKYGPDYQHEFIDLTLFLHGGLSEKGHQIKGLLDYRVENPRLHVLYSIVNRSLFHEISRQLRKNGLIAKKKQCGNCKYLGAGDLQLCESEHILDKKTGKRYPNKLWMTERQAHDKGCDAYVPLRNFFITDDEPGHDLSDGMQRHQRSEASRDQAVVFKALRECIRKASPAKKTIHTRRLEDWAYIYARVRDGFSPQEAIKRLLDVRTSGKKQREAYAIKHERDREAIEHCFSGMQPCR